MHMCTCLHAYMCTCVHMHMCTCLHAYMCTCVHVYMCACAGGDSKGSSLQDKVAALTQTQKDLEQELKTREANFRKRKKQIQQDGQSFIAEMKRVSRCEPFWYTIYNGGLHTFFFFCHLFLACLVERESTEHTSEETSASFQDPIHITASSQVYNTIAVLISMFIIPPFFVLCSSLFHCVWGISRRFFLPLSL